MSTTVRNHGTYHPVGIKCLKEVGRKRICLHESRLRRRHQLLRLHRRLFRWRERESHGRSHQEVRLETQRHRVSTKLYWGSANGTNPINNNGLSRKRIIEGLDASLARLQLSYVDLVYAHRPDRNTPIEETVRAFNHVINQGKAFYWGTSEWNQDEIAAAWRYADKLGLIGPLMEQPQYNMLCRQRVESDYISLIRERGLGLAIFSPLKTGVLTGKYNEGIPADSRLSQASKDPFIKAQSERYGDEAWKKDLEIVKKLGPVAEKLGVSLTVLAYAWVLRNPHVSTALTGASKPEQVYESVKALGAVKLLTDEVMGEIEAILQNRPAEVARKTWY
jgi:aryl-alcohol dehydrogenase-like predicted oxidoreductase